MAVEDSPPIRKWLKKLPWRAKPRVPCERAYKTVSETAVKSDPAFCFGPTIQKTNSAWLFPDFEVYYFVQALQNPIKPATTASIALQGIAGMMLGLRIASRRTAPTASTAPGVADLPAAVQEVVGQLKTWRRWQVCAHCFWQNNKLLVSRKGYCGVLSK